MKSALVLLLTLMALTAQNAHQGNAMATQMAAELTEVDRWLLDHCRLGEDERIPAIRGCCLGFVINALEQLPDTGRTPGTVCTADAECDSGECVGPSYICFGICAAAADAAV